MALREVTPIKKIALPAEPKGGCYLINFYTDSPEEKTTGDAIPNTPTKIARGRNAISHLAEVYTFLSLALLSFRGVRFN